MINSSKLKLAYKKGIVNSSIKLAFIIILAIFTMVLIISDWKIMSTSKIVLLCLSDILFVSISIYLIGELYTKTTRK